MTPPGKAELLIFNSQHTPSSAKSSMPDIANESKMAAAGTLHRVGMSGIEVPVFYESANGRPLQVPARANAFVSLDDPSAKGIHMSRLFLTLQETLAEYPANFSTLKLILNRFLESHKDTSTESQIEIHFDFMTLRKSLISDNEGWRTYPVTLGGTLQNGKYIFELKTKVVYSSTCPCSAALARQIIQKDFWEHFKNQDSLNKEEVFDYLGSEEGISATPHSQRSYAEVSVYFENESQAPGIIELIDGLETVLQTSVQAAVKREDEQEFARLNARNLMFCEDAARRIQSLLECDTRFVNYRAQVNHVESLHPHDAVAIVTKQSSK